MIIILNILHAIRIGSSEEVWDIEAERDKLINLKGEKVAYVTFSVGVFLSMLAFALGQPALVMFGLIIFFSIFAEIIGSSSQILRYSRGF